mmetsp:Transcript_23547/g.76107  ORF Transcript_23547/g.76107 Transcript_23547/m.76107 type:complete len:209 (-) Transcript_23547:118-744(-)
MLGLQRRFVAGRQRDQLRKHQRQRQYERYGLWSEQRREQGRQLHQPALRHNGPASGPYSASHVLFGGGSAARHTGSTGALVAPATARAGHFPRPVALAPAHHAAAPPTRRLRIALYRPRPACNHLAPGRPPPTHHSAALPGYRGCSPVVAHGRAAPRRPGQAGEPGLVRCRQQLRGDMRNRRLERGGGIRAPTGAAALSQGERGGAPS